MSFNSLHELNFQIQTQHHAEAILTQDMPEAMHDIESVLKEIQLPIPELIRGGGGECELTQRLRSEFSKRGWKKHRFQIDKIVDGKLSESITHEIDHVKKFESGTFALEIEWNNKDTLFDRDLENFKRLHAEGAISIGGIITRAASLHEALEDLFCRFAEKQDITSIEDLNPYNYKPTQRQVGIIAKSTKKKGFAKAWARQFFRDKFGESTTHWNKLHDRIRRGVGNPCPLLLIGIPDTIVRF